jgi:hypothetical protein
MESAYKTHILGRLNQTLTAVVRGMFVTASVQGTFGGDRVRRGGGSVFRCAGVCHGVLRPHPFRRGRGVVASHRGVFVSQRMGGQGIGMLAVGGLVVSMVDNFFARSSSAKKPNCRWFFFFRHPRRSPGLWPDWPVGRPPHGGERLAFAKIYGEQLARSERKSILRPTKINAPHRSSRPVPSHGGPFRDTRTGGTTRSIFVEGRRLLEEFLDSPLTPREAAVTPAVAADPQTAPLLEALKERGAPFTLVTPSVMEFLSDLETPPGHRRPGGSARPWILASLPLWGPRRPSCSFGRPPVARQRGRHSSVCRSRRGPARWAFSREPPIRSPPRPCGPPPGAPFGCPFSHESVPSLTALRVPHPPRCPGRGRRRFSERTANGTGEQPCLLILGGEARGVTPKSFGALPVRTDQNPHGGPRRILERGRGGGDLLIEARRQRSAFDTDSAIP